MTKTSALTAALLLFGAATAHAIEYKTKTTEDGQVTVKYRVYDRELPTGDTQQTMDYVVTKVVDGQLPKLLATIKDSSKHKTYLGITESREVGRISGDSWVTHYFFDMPWPMSDSDAVVTYHATHDAGRGTAVVTGKQTPDAHPRKDVDRVSYYDVKYTLEEKSEGKVEVTIALAMASPASGPKWMLNSWFPGGPTDVLNRLVDLSR